MNQLEYDSEDWRSLRNSFLHNWIKDAPAVQFLLTIGSVAEVWDDLVDKDKEVTESEINQTFFSLLVELPLNPFFDKYKFRLIPLMVTGINTWQDSNILSKGSDNDKAMAYVLRDWYVELVMFVMYLLHGYEAMREASMDIRRFFSQHETLQAYMEKSL